MTVIEQETMNAVKMAARKYVSDEPSKEKMRYEIACECMAAFIGKCDWSVVGYMVNKLDEYAALSVKSADALIKALNAK